MFYRWIHFIQFSNANERLQNPPFRLQIVITLCAICLDDFPHTFTCFNINENEKKRVLKKIQWNHNIRGFWEFFHLYMFFLNQIKNLIRVSFNSSLYLEKNLNLRFFFLYSFSLYFTFKNEKTRIINKFNLVGSIYVFTSINYVFLFLLFLISYANRCIIDYFH